MGILFLVLFSLVAGSVAGHLLGLGRLGGAWHLGIGLAGTGLGWVFVGVLHFPEVSRLAFEGWSVYPVWAAVGTLTTGIALALLLPAEDAP